MLFIKSLFLIGLVGGGITIPLVQQFSSTEEKLESLEYKNISEKWKRALDKIPGDSLKDKLTAVFSRNLTKFANSALEGIIKQLLVNWVIEIWKKPENYFPLSHKLNKFFSEYQFRYWKSKNELDELSWDLIKNFFIDFFFKEKGWFFLSKTKDFRDFVLEEWKKKEKPFTVYEKNLKYSSGGSKIYDSTVHSSRRVASTFLWPEFQKDEQYSSFISKFRNRKTIDHSFFSKKIWTLSDLKEIEDGRKLGALLFLLQHSEKNNAENISSLELNLNYYSDHKHIDNIEENPLYLFLDKEPNQGKSNQDNNKEGCILIPNSIFQWDFSKGITNAFRASRNIMEILTHQEETHSCLYSVRELKNSSSSDKVFASREKEGVSFYFIPDSTKKAAEKYKIDNLPEDVYRKIESFLKNNFEEIFAKYLKSINGSNGGEQSFEIQLSVGKVGKEKWSWKEEWTKYKELLEAATDYLDQLYWGKNVLELQKKLSSSYEDLPNVFQLKEENGGTKKFRIQLQKSEGLFSPLPYKRTIDLNGEEDKEITFSELRGQNGNGGGTTRKNDGFYTNLVSSFIDQKELYSLENKAKKLREELKKIQTSDNYDDLFYKSFLSRFQFEKMINNKTLIMNTLFQLWAEKEVFGKQNTENNEEISSQLSTFKTQANIQDSTNGSSSNWGNLVENTFFLESYLMTSLQDKSIFGSHKSQQQQQQQDSEDKVRLTKAKNAWILKNYYLSDAGYDASSEEMQQFYQYLFALKWLTKNESSNLQNLIHSIFRRDRKNKNAYLVWLKEISTEEVKTIHQEQEGNKTKEKLPDLFKKALATDIMNPLLLGKTNITEQEKTSLSLTNGGKDIAFKEGNILFNVKAYKENNGEKKDKELGGFLGLVTSSFSSRELPGGVKDKIFNEFFKSNSKENTNYSSAEEDKKEGGGLEGLYFEDNYKNSFNSNSELKAFLEEFKYKDKLRKYLNEKDEQRPYPLLLQALSKARTKDLDSYSIEELKKELSEILSDTQKANSEEGKENNKNLYKMWNRFSGYWYDSKSSKPYILENISEGGKNKNYVIFLYQVNQWDFSKEQIIKFKENLSDKTFNTMLSLLASNKQIQEWIYSNELTRRINLS